MHDFWRKLFTQKIMLGRAGISAEVAIWTAQTCFKGSVKSSCDGSNIKDDDNILGLPGEGKTSSEEQRQPCTKTVRLAMHLVQ